MSVFEQMRGSGNRRCRPETLLRLLMSTSYPQSTLSDLTLELAVQGGQTNQDDLEQDAQAMREVEKSYTLFDFVRCVEIKRVNGVVKVITKCLDIDPTMKTVNDNVETHVQMAASTIELINGESSFIDPDSVAVKLLELFYRSQIKSKRHGDTLEKTTWRYRSKSHDRSKVPQKRESVDTDIDVTNAIQKLSNSLRKKNFHVVLTQNTILLIDQKARLYGVSIK